MAKLSDLSKKKYNMIITAVSASMMNSYEDWYVAYTDMDENAYEISNSSMSLSVHCLDLDESNNSYKLFYITGIHGNRDEGIVVRDEKDVKLINEARRFVEEKLETERAERVIDNLYSNIMESRFKKNNKEDDEDIPF